MPKINFDQSLETIDGKVLKEKDEKGKERSAILKNFCVNALLASFPDEKIDGTEKMKRFVLAKTLSRGGNITIKTEDVVIIKEIVGKAFSPLIVGQIYEILEK